jgi:hypothetical protein
VVLTNKNGEIIIADTDVFNIFTAWFDPKRRDVILENMKMIDKFIYMYSANINMNKRIKYNDPSCATTSQRAFC